MQKNPNPRGACACNPLGKVVDCTGPYCVFTHLELSDPRQPHVVVGDKCMRRGVEKAHPGAFKVQTVEVEVERAPVDIEAVVAAVRNSLVAKTS
jgi:hypothetical protein